MAIVHSPLLQPPFRSRATRAVCLTSIAAALVIGSALLLKDRLAPKRWGVVEPGLIYRSGQISSYLVSEVLAKNRIQVVVDLTGDDPANPDQPAEREAIARLGIELVKCPLLGDGTGDIESYTVAIAKISESRAARKPVLVHCFAGAQRTGGVVAAYRLLVEKAPPPAAYAELQQYGWSPRKDRILVDYLNSHMESLARELVARGVLDQVPQPVPQVGP